MSDEDGTGSRSPARLTPATPVAGRRRPGAGTSVHVGDPQTLVGPAMLRFLIDRGGAALAIAPATAGGEVRVRITDDAGMTAAHKMHLDDPTTTDVLTFDLAGGAAAGGAPLDVDVLVNVDEARRQGAARGHTPERELLLYVVHAVLHCLGYDDHDASAAARMHAEEDRILAAIGVGATYARPETGRGAA